MKDSKIEIEKDFKKVNFRLRKDGIMNVTLKSHTNLFTIKDWEESMRWIASLGDKKYLNLFEGNFSGADALVREKSASKDENKYTIADAFVVKNSSDSLIGNFYIQFNKPHKPTEVFQNREDAIEWLLQFKK